MLRLSKTLLLIIALSPIKAQEPDKYDTLFTRSNKMILIARYDSIKQLQEINAKADTILNDLSLIKERLGILETDTKDTLKIK